MNNSPRDNTRVDGSASQDRPVRRPYRRPELVAYGALAKLTRGTKSGTGEITPQGDMKMCL